MISEAHHYTTFLGFARRYAGPNEDVEVRWQAFLDHEAELMPVYGRRETMHG
jgi:tRNA-(ms[2]io[6]A)-hydroxylase